MVTKREVVPIGAVWAAQLQRFTDLVRKGAGWNLVPSNHYAQKPSPFQFRQQDVCYACFDLLVVGVEDQQRRRIAVLDELEKGPNTSLQSLQIALGEFQIELHRAAFQLS